MPAIDFSVLLVTDRRQTQGRPLPAVLSAAVAGGVRAIHVRERDLPTRQLLALVQEVRSSLPASVHILVNDRIDLVLALEVEGVHLRADSLSVAAARRLVGDQRLVGVSTHSPDEAKRANEEGADYIVFGPVFETPSKQRFGAPLGLPALEQVCRDSTIPVFAIGGMTPERAASVLSCGASGLAVIGAVLTAADVERAARQLCDAAAHRK